MNEWHYLMMMVILYGVVSGFLRPAARVEVGPVIEPPTPSRFPSRRQ
jgi:hypothetical protein